MSIYISVSPQGVYFCIPPRVYLPEEPFVHGALQKGGRLKAFPSLEAETVHSEYRQPCVVFCGHPSLRSAHVLPFLQPC